jgi:cyanate permease
VHYCQSSQKYSLSSHTDGQLDTLVEEVVLPHCSQMVENFDMIFASNQNVSLRIYSLARPVAFPLSLSVVNRRPMEERSAARLWREAWSPEVKL